MKLVNGIAAETLSLADRAIQFGDGVFRTLKLCDGRLPFWARQYRKLAADCTALGITAPMESLLLDEIRHVQAGSGLVNATIKIIVTRGESARGYAIPADARPNRIVQIAPLPAYPASLYTKGATLRLCDMRAGWQPALAGIKHLNRLENVLARREWQDPAILEGLLLDRNGDVLEGVMSNVLLLKNGTLVTPDLSAGGVAGVMREAALDAAGSLAWQTAIRAVPLAELYEAEAVWICNSLLGIVPVARLGETAWSINTALPDRVAQMAKEEVR